MKYRVERRGSDTTIVKAKFWQSGEEFEVIRRRVLRELRANRDAFEDGHDWVSRLGTCALCGVVTHTRDGLGFACKTHGGIVNG